MSTGRRDLLIGLACVAGASAAYALTPRRRVTLMPAAGLAALTPTAFGSWSSRDVSDLVAPQVQGSLSQLLYNQTLERVYIDSVSGAEIMMLLAHGDTQSNELQLHRPEVCYPAFGFEISGDSVAAVPLARGASLPIRQLVADAPGRRENIAYWTRLGQYLPLSENEQRLDRVETALHGYIADGLLARFSTADEDSSAAWPQLQTFIAAFVKAITPDARTGFVGPTLATARAASR